MREITMQTFRLLRNSNSALVGILLLTCILAIRPEIMAQRDPVLVNDADLRDRERRGAEMAPAMRDFGDLSVAFRNLAHRALPSVVSIDAISRPTRRCEGPLWRHTFGSGFIIDSNGIILTSSELVFGADHVKVRLRDGSEFMASSVRLDPRSNVAVVEISPVANLPALPLGGSDAMQVGDWVLSLGRNSRTNPIAASGIINAVVPGPGPSRNEDFFQTEAAMTVTGRGGPLLNLNGQVVGINTAVSHWDELFDRTDLAVPSNLAKWSSRQLIDNGIVTRGFLGVNTQPMNAQMAKQFGAPLGQGALVRSVISGSEAAEAKLKPGDVITKIGGDPIIDPRHLQTVTEHLTIGKSYPVEIIRDGERVNLMVTAGKMSDQMSLVPRPQRVDPTLTNHPAPANFADLGLEVKELTPELIQQFGLQAGIQGVMINTVHANTPAAAAGLQSGMVIEKVDKKAVTTLSDFKATEADIAANHGALLYIHTRQGARFVSVGPDEY